MPLVLVIHELSANAAKYGALADPNGFLDVQWSKMADQVWIEWAEKVSHPIPAPKRKGFGTKLITSALTSFGGAVETVFTSSGIVCTISIPVAAIS